MHTSKHTRIRTKSHHFSGGCPRKLSKPMLKAGGLKLNQSNKKMRWLLLSKHLHLEWALKAMLCKPILSTRYLQHIWKISIDSSNFLVEHARQFQNTPECMLDSFRYFGTNIHPCCIYIIYPCPQNIPISVNLHWLRCASESLCIICVTRVCMKPMDSCCVNKSAA